MGLWGCRNLFASKYLYFYQLTSSESQKLVLYYIEANLIGQSLISVIILLIHSASYNWNGLSIFLHKLKRKISNSREKKRMKFAFRFSSPTSLIFIIKTEIQMSLSVH